MGLNTTQPNIRTTDTQKNSHFKKNIKENYHKSLTTKAKCT